MIMFDLFASPPPLAALIAQVIIEFGFPQIIVVIFIGAACLCPYFFGYRCKIVEVRPHCVACLYPIEQDTEACPECGEVVPWNCDLPPGLKEPCRGVARCNRCETKVPRAALFDLKGEWVCHGCGCILLVKPPHILDWHKMILSIVMLVILIGPSLAASIYFSIEFMSGESWAIFTASFALFCIFGWLSFPITKSYIVKDARMHCVACKIAVPDGSAHCPNCLELVAYPEREV